MGLFSKIKNMFKGYDEEEKDAPEKEIEEVDSEKEVEEIEPSEKTVEEDNQDISEKELEEDEESDNTSEEDIDDEQNEEDSELEVVEEGPKKKSGLFGIGSRKEKKIEEEKKSVKVYEKGLSRSREGFVSKLANLTNKYKKITDEYFDDGNDQIRYSKNIGRIRIKIDDKEILFEKE